MTPNGIKMMETTLTMAEVRDSGRFELLRELPFAAIAPFVTEYYWKKRGPVVYLHYAVSLLFAILWLVAGLRGEGTLSDWLVTWGGGLGLFFLLLPIHEALHGLAYKYHGATDVRYGFEWRQLIAYATAHNFVIDRRRFVGVALLPFLVINGLLLLAAVLLPQHSVLLLAALFWHTSGTAGDFALLNYLWFHRDRDVYTYDDAETKTSYFYATSIK